MGNINAHVARVTAKRKDPRPAAKPQPAPDLQTRTKSKKPVKKKPGVKTS